MKMIVYALEGSWTIFENPAVKRSSLIDGGTETTEVELLLVDQSQKLKYASIFEVNSSNVFPSVSLGQGLFLVCSFFFSFFPAIRCGWLLVRDHYKWVPPQPRADPAFFIENVSPSLVHFQVTLSAPPWCPLYVPFNTPRLPYNSCLEPSSLTRNYFLNSSHHVEGPPSPWNGRVPRRSESEECRFGARARAGGISQGKV